MMSDREKILERKLARAKKSQEEAEKLLEEKSLELYQANQKLQDINSHLEERIEQRTKQFEEEKNKALAASAAKSQFLANMSHEIRTPLNGMLGFIDILKKNPLTDEQKRYLSTVSHSGDLLLSIINDILEFSRIEAGHLEINEKSFDLRDTVESLVDVLALKAYEKDLEVPIYISSNISEKIFCDEGRLRQVLVNIVGNAIKFTHFGEVALQVNLKDPKTLIFEVIDTGVGIPEEKIAKIFEAFTQTDESDTRKYGGTGLGLTISKKIVQAMGGEIGLESETNKGSRFYFTIPYKPVGEAEAKKIHNPVKPVIVFRNKTILSNLCHRFDSWGVRTGSYNHINEKFWDHLKDCTHLLIDESIVKDLSHDEKQRLKNFSSEIDIAIAFNSGRELELNAPILATQVVKPLRAKVLWNWLLSKKSDFKSDSTRQVESLTENTSAQRRALIVDDDKTNLLILETLVKSNNFECVLAKNGESAIDRLKNKGPFNVILMDLQMPVMDGFDATKEIRRIDKDIPIIAVTANSLRETQERCFEVGMNDFLMKPIKASKLQEHLEAHVGELSLEKSNSSEARSPEKVGPSASSAKRAKILLVEDNPINRELALVVLEAGGYDCVVAENGQIGVEQFEKEGPFDLVLMDCQMPVMDGFEATRILRKISPGPKIPIVAMTANAFESTKEECLKVGMNDFITKPIKDEDLYENIEKNLKAA